VTKATKAQDPMSLAERAEFNALIEAGRVENKAEEASVHFYPQALEGWFSHKWPEADPVTVGALNDDDDATYIYPQKTPDTIVRFKGLYALADGRIATASSSDEMVLDGSREVAEPEPLSEGRMISFEDE